MLQASCTCISIQICNNSTSEDAPRTCDSTNLRSHVCFDRQFFTAPVNTPTSDASSATPTTPSLSFHSVV